MPGCRNAGRTLRFCINGRTFDRQCAADERCQAGACVYQPPPDAGSTCRPGCAGSTTVRRCVGGEAVDLACGPFQACADGDCHDVDAGVGPPPDGGACVDTCVDTMTARICTSTGQAMVVTCNEDSPCSNGRCVPPAEPGPAGNCGCTGLSTVAGIVFAGLVLRRRRGP
ncbi:MAG: hypothetical protein HY904_23370 [Deltaproteobacteria bacterium]|nr:hypothetical protein [Deltaproteobacteria bacterium]